MPTDEEYTFSTLNFWRKLYVVIVWVLYGGAGAGLFVVSLLFTMNGGAYWQSALIFAGAAIPMFFAWWTHYAISGRHVGQQIGVLLLNLAHGNIVFAAIMLPIILAAKSERDFG